MKLLIQNNRIAGTATDAYTGPDTFIDAPADFDVTRLGEYSFADGVLTAPTPISPQAATWGRIKAERDRRQVLGVKVGAHWYHSDTESRLQQIGLFIMGSNVPAVQWKTLTLSGPPVFVTMTQAIAGGIFQGTAESDAAIFAAAETHRVAMEASDTPESYDITSGWPASIEDAL
jgi:hypothetical protein